MLDPDETLRYLDFFDSRAVEGEDEPPSPGGTPKRTQSMRI